MLQNQVGEMTEIDIDNSQIGGVINPYPELQPPPSRQGNPSTSVTQNISPDELINKVKKLNIDNANIILNIHKINILNSNLNNNSKFFYILDKSVRKYLNKNNELLQISGNNIEKKIYNDIYNDILNESLSFNKNNFLDNIKSLIDTDDTNYLKNYDNLNYKKYLFLLLEPGLSNDKTNIDGIFEPFKKINFAYNLQYDPKFDENFDNYINNEETLGIKYKKFVFLFLKILEKIIETELGKVELQDLYTKFGVLIDSDEEKLDEEKLDENIKNIKESYTAIKNLLNNNNNSIINKIIEDINKLNKIEKYKTIGRYINFNGFELHDDNDKKNLIKILIFLLYNIDNNNNEFGLDNTSFTTIFNSTEKDGDIQTNVVQIIVNEAIESIKNKPGDDSKPGPGHGTGGSDDSNMNLEAGGKKKQTQKSRRKSKKNKTR